MGEIPGTEILKYLREADTETGERMKYHYWSLPVIAVLCSNWSDRRTVA